VPIVIPPVTPRPRAAGAGQVVYGALVAVL